MLKKIVALIHTQGLSAIEFEQNFLAMHENEVMPGSETAIKVAALVCTSRGDAAKALAKASGFRVYNPARDLYQNIPLIDATAVTGVSYHANRVSYGEFTAIIGQGPHPRTPSAAQEFKALLLKEGCDMVLAVTDPTDRQSRTKCFNYSPTVFTPIKKDAKEELISSTLDVGAEKSIELIYYRNWPDHGCPTNRDALLGLIAAARRARLPFIHCSAGIGRSGVTALSTVAQLFIDKNMETLRNLPEKNVAGVLRKFLIDALKHLRTQRWGLVQTPEQLNMCLEISLSYILTANEIK